MKEIRDKYTNCIFECIKYIDDYGDEFWFARELQKVLEYKDWLVEVNKPLKTGKGKEVLYLEPIK